MSIKLLPVELQLEIFVYLRTRDLKALRYVTKELRQTAASVLFRRAVVCARYQAFRAFLEIARNPTLSTNVKEIVFDGSVYDGNIAERKAFYLHHTAALPGLQKGSFLENHQRWERYGQLFNDQDDLQTGTVMYEAISAALEWMPNLSSIVYSPHPRLVPVEAQQMKGVLSRGVVCAPVRQEHDGGYAASNHPFRQLVRGLYLAEHTGVKSLRVEAPLRGIPSTEFSLLLFEMKGNDVDAAEFLFQHLEKIELNVALMGSSTTAPTVVGLKGMHMLGRMSHLLSLAKNLQHLAFHLTHWEYSPNLMYGHIVQGGPLFPFLGLGTTWRQLQSLSLEGVYGNSEDFINLITRHKRTLVMVVFKQCSILRGSWAEVVDEVVRNSSIYPFMLDRVNETHLGGHFYWGQLNASVRATWRYSGRVEVLDDGRRVFLDTNNHNPEKHSVYWMRV